MTTAWCGIDVGTQGVRALVVDAHGDHRGGGRAALPAGTRSAGRHEQDPASWRAAVATAVGEAVSAAAGTAGGVELAGLALDATSGTVLVEGADGEPRGPALMYDDARAGEQAVRVQAVGEPLWSALGYRMQPTWALPKVLWLLEQGAVGARDTVVHQADHLVRWLTGGPVATDTSHALKTGVDPRSVGWPADVLLELGVPTAALPPVVLPGTVLGRVGAEAAAATGLPPGLPVHAGMTDGCAAQIASGALAPGSWSSALGTTLVVKGSTADLVRDPSGAVYSHRSPDGGWLPGGASSTGAGVVRERFGSADLDALTARASGLGVPAGVTYPLAGRGERFPFVAPGAHGFTKGVPDDPAWRFSAVCHGVAHVERLAYDVLRVLGADVSGPVSVSGGATANRWWNQLRADVLGRTVLVPASVEAAAGMAVLAAAPAGQLARTARRMVRTSARLEPDPERGPELLEGYGRLVAALVDRGWLDADLAARCLQRPSDRSPGRAVAAEGRR